MNIAETIIPIFAVILMGWIARRRGFLPPAFISSANRLVFYIAIPAMIFRSIASASLRDQFQIRAIVGAIFAMIIAFTVAWIIGRWSACSHRTRGSFVQCAFHGNLGYIGLAVSFYYLGDSGLTQASIIAGFVMIAQNFLAVIALQMHSTASQSIPFGLHLFRKIIHNPVIISAVCGIIISLIGVPIPSLIDRTLKILSGMALPTALLIIGASLSLAQLRARITLLTFTTLIKLIMLPAIGAAFYWWFNLNTAESLPGIILLASPSATIAAVMASEMDGDEEFAVGAVSISTVASMVTFTFWLAVY